MSNWAGLIEALLGGHECPPEISPLNYLEALVEDARRRGPVAGNDDDAYWRMVSEVDVLISKVKAALGTPLTLSIEAIAGMAMPDDFEAWYPRLKRKPGAKLSAGAAYQDYVRTTHRRNARALPPETFARLMTALAQAPDEAVVVEKLSYVRNYIGWELSHVEESN